MIKTFHSFIAALLAIGASVFAGEFDSAGVKIHYIEQGTGEPVILIHGLYASGQMNWGAPGIVADLARHYRVIALDCRGHGLSGKPAGEGEYGAKMVEDVVRLMDHLRLPSTNLIGYSMGGMIAMKLAVTHPDRVRSAILGGMGWLSNGSPQQKFWENLGGRGGGNSALLRGFTEFAITADEVKAIKAPLQVVVGERDPCRQLYVKPLVKLRPDISEHVIAGAGHLGCVIKSEFKTELSAALERNLAPR